MKTNWVYEARCFKKDEKGRLISIGIVDGVTNNENILASMFRQHPEVISADKVDLHYYELGAKSWVA